MRCWRGRRREAARHRRRGIHRRCPRESRRSTRAGRCECSTRCARTCTARPRPCPTGSSSSMPTCGMPRPSHRALRGVDAVAHQAAKVGLGVDFSDAPDYVGSNDLGTATLLAAMARRPCVGSCSPARWSSTARAPTAGSRGPTRPRAANGGRPGCGAVRPALTVRASRSRPSSSTRTRRSTRATSTRQPSSHRSTSPAPGLGRPAAWPSPCAITTSTARGCLRTRHTRASRPCSAARSSGGRRRASSRTARSDATSCTFGTWHPRTCAAAGASPRSRSRGPSGHSTSAAARCTRSAIWPAALSRHSGGPAPVVTGEYRLGDVRHITASSARLRDELGWAPAVAFDERDARVRDGSAARGGAVIASTSSSRASTRRRPCRGCSPAFPRAIGRSSSTTAPPTARPRSPASTAPSWSSSRSGASAPPPTPACSRRPRRSSPSATRMPRWIPPTCRSSPRQCSTGAADLVLGRRRPTTARAWPWHALIREPGARSPRARCDRAAACTTSAPCARRTASRCSRSQLQRSAQRLPARDGSAGARRGVADRRGRRALLAASRAIQGDGHRARHHHRRGRHVAAAGRRTIAARQGAAVRDDPRAHRQGASARAGPRRDCTRRSASSRRPSSPRRASTTRSPRSLPSPPRGASCSTTARRVPDIGSRTSSSSPSPTGDLDERLGAIFDAVRGPTMLIGMDTPQLRATDLAPAFGDWPRRTRCLFGAGGRRRLLGARACASRAAI